MKLLDRYLMAQFAKNLALVICSLIAIYLLVDFFERMDNFLEAKKPSAWQSSTCCSSCRSCMSN